MAKKQIPMRLGEDIFETSKNLQKLALEEEGLTFFTLQAKSDNAWNSYVYQMGLVKIKQDFDKFLEIQNQENETKSNNQGR